jgi:hypothetical protein
VRWPIERSSTVLFGKAGVGGSIEFMCAGLSTVVFGDIIVDVGIHWIRPCMPFVAIFCHGVGMLSLAVGLCYASSVASHPPMGPRLLIILI